MTISEEQSKSVVGTDPAPWPPPSPALMARQVDFVVSYRPELDGIRAVAVYAVVLFHAGVVQLSGGFVGVDVFFVLSGYLITTLLIRGWNEGGSVGLTRFYARRIRRLLPAAVAAVVITYVAAWSLLAASDRTNLTGDARSALLWVANWRAIAQGNDYFNIEEAPSPFLHFWSLSVEEQFYLIWPLIVLLLCLGARRFGKRPEVLVLATALMIGGLSVFLGRVTINTDPLRNYYGTDVRMYQLLAGAVVATGSMIVPISRARGKAIWLQAAGIVGILFLATDAVALSSWPRGLLVTAATCLLLIGFELGRDSVVVSCLSWSPLVRLGQLSYGTYLWHWPIIVLTAATFRVGSLTLAMVAGLGATAAASLSAEFLERPIRRSTRLDGLPKLVVIVGLGVSIGTALVLPHVVSGLPEIRPINTSGETTGAISAEWDEIKRDGGVAPECSADDPSSCILVRGDAGQPHLHLVGDSHARSTIRMFERIALERGYTLSVSVGSGCPWQYGMLPPRSWGSQADECEELQSEWYDTIIPELEPDVVLAMSYSFDSPVSPLEMRAAIDAEAGLPPEELHEASVARAVKAITDAGANAVIIEPLPIAPDMNPLSCLSSGMAPASCSFEVDARSIPAESFYRMLAANDERVVTMDLDPLTCPDLPVCAAVVDGTVVRRDDHHVTATYFESVWDQAAQLLDQLGAID